MTFANTYSDDTRADSYDALEFPGTYYLAFRDLPDIIGRHVAGGRALDFGCGAGRSTRFVRALGFDVTGIDISSAMVDRARKRDPDGDYRLLPPDDLSALADDRFDLITAIFPFDNIPTSARKLSLFRSLRERLTAGGRMIVLVSAPEIYLNEWTSFSTRDFPENRTARSGDTVRIVMLDVPDRRPVEDILCTEESYREIFREAGLRLIETHRPLGRVEDPHEWVGETAISPWAIHVLGAASV